MGWRSDPTAELPILGRVDLSEAYAAVRRRGGALRRRRLISSIVAGAILATVFSVIGVYYVTTIPLPDALSLPETTTVYYSDGVTVLARLGTQNRIAVDVDALPSYLPAAVVAAEDPGFAEDSATKISRQYVRAAAGLDVDTLSGQAEELILASKLEDDHTKPEILSYYLNTVYFGRGSYGVGAAAQAYFGVAAEDLDPSQAALLAGLLASPGDGAYDPTVDADAAQHRFTEVVRAMTAAGAVDQATADTMRVPDVRPYNPEAFESGLDRPTGLVVSHVLAELRASPAFEHAAPGTLENGGFSIVTTIDARAQDVLEHAADGGTDGSVMRGQPDNLQAAAVMVEPRTGRVLAYYGGSDGTGADFAGWYTTADGTTVGYGSHPPGQTMDVYTLAAALDAGMSVKSRWAAPPSRTYPGSGRGPDDPVRDTLPAACQPTCTLAQAATAGLNVPYFSVTEKLTAGRVIDVARAAGIDSMWVPDSAQTTRRRYDLRAQTGAQLSPSPFGAAVGLGEYPVTVEDQANGMATFAAGGLRADAHFVTRVTRRGATVYSEPNQAPRRVLSATAAADLSWALTQQPVGHLSGGRVTASQTGVWALRDSLVETAHAWTVGYTPNLALAVWVGNVETELPLKDSNGARVIGSGLPAQIYRSVMEQAPGRMGLPTVSFPAPSFGGDIHAGDAG